MFETVVKPSESAVCANHLDPFVDIEEQIQRLRREKNAIVLAHYYQNSEIQDIADFVGDSLDLSRTAANTKAEMIAFCGVRFMGECAKILKKIRAHPLLRPRLSDDSHRLLLCLYHQLRLRQGSQKIGHLLQKLP